MNGDRNYALKEVRKQTFAQTTKFSQQLQQQLISEGFYLIENLVKCFACGASANLLSVDETTISKLHRLTCTRRQQEDTEVEPETLAYGIQERPNSVAAPPPCSPGLFNEPHTANDDFQTREEGQGPQEKAFLSPYDVELAKTQPVERPSIGYFWDIENCQVPAQKSAFDLVGLIRQHHGSGLSEKIFKTAVDATKLSEKLQKDLDDAKVEICHVKATQKNAADDKLKDIIRSFGEEWNVSGMSVTVVIITGDCNFIHIIQDLIYKYQHEVVLIHKEKSQVNFIKAASKAHVFEELLKSCENVGPSPNPKKIRKSLSKLYVSNLPTNIPDTLSEDVDHKIENQLTFLSDNCGGRVLNVKNGLATMSFPNDTKAERALFRLPGERIYDSPITVSVEPPKHCEAPSVKTQISSPSTSYAQEPVQEDNNDGATSLQSLPILMQSQDDLASEYGDVGPEIDPSFSDGCWKDNENVNSQTVAEFMTTMRNEFNKLSVSLKEEIKTLHEKINNLSSDNQSLRSRVEQLEEEKVEWEKEKKRLLSLGHGCDKKGYENEIKRLKLSEEALQTKIEQLEREVEQLKRQNH